MSLGQPIKEKYYDRIDIAQLVVSILIFFLSLSFAAFAGLAGLGMSVSNFESLAYIDPTILIVLGLTALVFMVIAAVSAVTTIREITGHAGAGSLHIGKGLVWFIGGALLVFGLAALITPARLGVYSAVLAVLAVAGVTIPVFGLLWYGIHGQTRITPKRVSGILVFTVGVSTPFIVLVEFLLLIILVLLVFAGLFNNPQFRELFTAILNDPTQLQTNPQKWLSEIRTVISLPKMVGWVMLTVAGIMPLVEELFKTLGVWLLKVRNPRPEESYRVGLACGAGFALFEGLLSVNSLNLTKLGFVDWATIILGRFGGSLLHIFVGGIIGLAIGKFWQNRRFGSLLLAYLGAWLLHAAWNSLAIFGGINPLIDESQAQAIWPYIGLGVLVLGVLFGFARLKKIARKAENLQVSQNGLEG